MSVVVFDPGRKIPASPLGRRPGSHIPTALLSKLDAVADVAPHLLATVEQLADAALASARQDAAAEDRAFHARIIGFVRDIVRPRRHKAEWLLFLTETFMARALAEMRGA